MSFNDYNRIIGISTLSTSESSGDITPSWGTAVNVRASVTQIDGTRYLSAEELIDRAVYLIKLFDNGYSDNIKITYGTLVLYPIRPITKNPGAGSNTNEITILAATKK